VIILQKLFIKSLVILKRSFLIASLSLLSSNLFSFDYYKHNFLDSNNTYHFRANANPKSNILYFNTFEKDWQNLPDHKEENIAFGTAYADLYYTFENYKFGTFWEKSATIAMDEGLIQTWYYANKDFNTLLHMQDIGNNISATSINGNANYYESYGIYLQKTLSLNNENFLSLKMNLLFPKNMQNLTVAGYNTSTRFVGSFDYYYSDKNHISKSLEKTNNAKGYGYGIDIEYIYKTEKLYIYGGLLNVGGKIHWSGLTKMHYDLDSKTVYLGSDGFNHRKPFGVGKYEYNVDYTQTLPLFYQASLDYKIGRYFSFGNNLNGYKNVIFQEPYITCKIVENRLKLGYIYDAKRLVFGFFMKHLKLEFSNKIGPANRAITVNLHIYF